MPAINKWLRAFVMERDGRRCVYCGTNLSYLTVDHLHPRCYGGSNQDWNLVAACKTCNTKRGDGPPPPLRDDAPEATKEVYRRFMARKHYPPVPWAAAPSPHP